MMVGGVRRGVNKLPFVTIFGIITWNFWGAI